MDGLCLWCLEKVCYRTRYTAITPDSGGGVNGVRVNSHPRNLVYY